MLALTDSQELTAWQVFLAIRAEDEQYAREVARHGEVHDPRRDVRTDDEEDSEDDDDGETEQR